MEDNGFKNVKLSSEFDGVRFQVVGEAKIGLQKMPTVLRIIDILDDDAAKRTADEFLLLHKKKSSYVFGTFFLYCLISERMDRGPSEWLLRTVGEGSHGLKDNLGAGGGHLIIADASTGMVITMKTKEGPVRYERKMIEIISQAIGKSSA